MNILMDIAHPAHVHLLRHTYDELTRKGHRVLVTVKHIPSAIQLLDLYTIPYLLLGNKKDSLIGKLFFQLIYNFKLLLLIYKNKIQIGFCSSLTVAQVSKLSKMKSIILDDDDDDVEPLFVKYAHPFADVILSPNNTRRKSKNTVFYSGYHELAYLHPYRFRPDVNVLKEIGLNENDVFFVLRFNSFKAHHDVGVSGISIELKHSIIRLLESKGKVFITTESAIDSEFAHLQLKLSPEKIHSLLYYATMFLGDSQTMTSEAAVLGTPAIRSNTFVGRITYLEEEEKLYDLTRGFLPGDSDKMLQTIEELLCVPNLKEVWGVKRAKMLQEKIDVSSFYVWFIENYPQTVEIMKNNPDYQYNFR